jgi:hypothetical protein
VEVINRLPIYLWIIAALLILGGIAYIELRWRRAPHARRAMRYLAVCYFTAGSILGGLLLHRIEQPQQVAQLAAPVILATPTQVAPTTAESFPSCAIEPAQALSCGAERWLVKTLSDPDASKVNWTAVPVTVTELGSLPRPDSLPADRRIPPVELQVYKVKAILTEYKREKDDDFHLVLVDPTNRTQTMIAEIPAPNCADGDAIERLEAPRCEFLSQFVDPGRSWSWTQPRPDRAVEQGTLVEVTGVGFFDFEHGQSGLAPNAIELHPVLSIRRID